MRLFIKDQPFHFYEEVDLSNQQLQRVEIRLKLTITEPNVKAPPQEPVLFDFVLDTAADYASVFPSNLGDSGIPVKGPSGGEVALILMDGSTIIRCMRDVTLWLYSSQTGLTNQPYRIDPNGGVVVLPEPNVEVAPLVLPLFGMNPLLDAGLRIELNAQTRLYSVWVPDQP